MKHCGTKKDTVILAESSHFAILKEYERASLCTKQDFKPVACVGDFYGDPQDAYIDPKEKFCITVGCGIILYYLREPFESYAYDKTSLQWIETGREGDALWCDRIETVTDTFFIITLENGTKRKVDLSTLAIEEWQEENE
ncbi:MAG: hypothetical protein IKW95_07735 [Lachnospiraceae bacterium]|nr:hypothetical protein [Lachnospiraceae bacterium]